jgi:hypothetical protein
MYATVPTAEPGLVRRSSEESAVAAVISGGSITFLLATLASPKSRIFTCPLFERKMFAGFMSR